MTIDELNAHLKLVLETFDFTRPARRGEMAREMAEVGAEAIRLRTVARQADATGARLKPNEPNYARWKQDNYGTSLPLRRTGQLLSQESIEGVVDVSPGEVAWRYGTDRPPTDSESGLLTEADRNVTDTEKAGFVSGERPFFGLDDPTCDRMAEVAADALEKHLEATK